MEIANKSLRLVNFSFDLIAIGIVYGISEVIFGEYINFAFLKEFCFFFYYFLFEVLFGRTIGKVITNTVVVNLDNSKPNFSKILLRTILRFNPFDMMSYLFGFELGAHDKYSRTKLVLNKKVTV